MKYELKIDNLIINQEDIKSIEIDLGQEINNNLVNEKSRVTINIFAYIYKNDLIKKIIELKDRYVDVNLKVDGLDYYFPKLYIQNLKQIFELDTGKFHLILTQKFIGSEEEIRVSDLI